MSDNGKIWCGFLAFLLLGLPLVSRGDAPFFMPQATVVLLTGLPGDVESETAYVDQLQAWVETGISRSVRRFLILSDSPESIQLPGKTEAKILQADRTHFEKLPELLAGETNAVIVISWGHGGRQGNLPVLHVRGPRLTPSDFQKFASSLAATNSSWILIFRGSGAFAAGLAGPGRRVLASDFETPFNNDPIAMPLLIEKLRTTPTISFDLLARDLGKAVAAWYQERHLARTEDPTFWVGTNRPVLMVAATDVGPPRANAELAGHLPESTAAQTEPIDLPPAWKEIRPVPPSNFPDADGVILRRELSYTLGSAPAVATEEDAFIQILRTEGKRFGDFDISYEPPSEEIHFLDCEVRRPNGTLLRLDPEQIREAGTESVGDYQFARRKFFSLPGVVPGAILRVRYRTEWQKFPLPHISMAVPLDHELAVLRTKLQVNVPRDAPFHFAFEQLAGADPFIKQTSYSTSYSWTFQNLPPRLPENLSLPDQHSQLLISTFPDWPAFAEWYGRISRLTDDLTPEVEARAAELTRDAATDREKVLALYKYVAGLRYVAVPLGINSFRPHAAANVLQNQFGDCKDKANLFNALLHTVKIDAHLVLLPRFRQAYDDVPGLAFNHAISQVLLGQETLWVDTTDDVCRFGLLPPGDPGRKVLVIDGQSKSLTQLPASRAEEHEFHLVGHIDALHLAEPLPIRLEAKVRGFPDYELRMVARQIKAQGRSVPLLSATFHPSAGAFALDRQTTSEIAALDEDFSCKAEGHWLGGIAAGSKKWHIHSPVWIPKQWESALHRRQGALFLNEGYPVILEEEFEFTLPAKAQLEALPAAHQNQSGPLRWRAEWARIADDKLSARFRAELAKGELSNVETVDCQEQLRQLFGALSECVTLRAQEPDE